MDYLLRNGGWLDEYRGKPGAEILVAISDDGIIAFTVISPKAAGSVEFRIALRPDQIGRGVGRQATLLTLDPGFSDHTIHRICLIVRKNNLRAQHLYESVCFRRTSECVEEIQGIPGEFFTMEIDRATLM